MNKVIKVMPVFGTRPEAIKMAPLIKELEKDNEIEVTVVVTGQHKDQLQQVLDAFEITPKFDMEIMKPNQTLVDISAVILTKFDPILKSQQPDIVLVHGDTSSSLAAGLGAFYNQIKIGHVEAGLRSFDKYQPFPEEINRKLLTHMCDLHFAPTEESKKNLINENIHEGIFVTGNTGIDAMSYTIKKDYHFTQDILNHIDYTNKKVVTVTAHRRENLGEPLADICQAILSLKQTHPELEFVYPMHLNPKVREVVLSILGGIEGIHLTEPLDIFDMHNLMSRSYLVLTDSGGLQEESPHLNVPVLVLRNVTERPEGVAAGVIKLVGTNKNKIIEEVNILLQNGQTYKSMADGKNPFGDGNASTRIVEEIKKYYGR